MTQDRSTEDRLELLAQLAEGTVSPDELDDETLEMLASEVGLDALAGVLAQSVSAGATGEPGDSARDADGHHEPVARLSAADFRGRLALAAVIAVVVGGATVVALLSRPPSGGPPTASATAIRAPLAWTAPLVGPSGLLDRPISKSRDAGLDSFLRSDESVTDAVAPGTVDTDGDGRSDAVVFGLTTIEARGASPWVVAVFAGDDPSVRLPREVEGWGPAELAAAGLRTALMCRRDGALVSARLGPDGTLEELAIDDDGDGSCDRLWTGPLDTASPCSGPLMSRLPPSQRTRLAAALNASAEPVGLPTVEPPDR